MSDKIIFMGTPDFSVPILKFLYRSNYKIETVYTQPPKKKFRGQNVEKSPIHLESIKLNIPVRHPDKLNNEEDLDLIKNKDSLEATYEEGCLSVPNQFAEINRPSKCEVEYLDYNGEKKILNAEGILATCIQHEMDHLEGILFIDYLSKLKKSMIIKKLSKSKSERIVV